MGPACPRHCEGPRLFFLEGAHDWENVFVLCISHCLVLKQVLKEKMRETIGKYSTKTYSKLHSIDIRTGNTKDGWKKHGIDRQPFFWFGTPTPQQDWNADDQDSQRICRSKRLAFDIIKGLACPRHCEGPRLFFLEGAHDWANVFVLCIFHCLVLKQVLKEKMRETIGTYSKNKDLLQVTFNIRTGNTKDGWKKHGINRQPFFWFGTRSNRITTKIPRESADQKDIVWYYHGSCMPKTAMVQSYSSWREHMIERMCSCFAFPTAWFWNRSWKRKCVKLLGHILQRPTPSYIRYPNW